MRREATGRKRVSVARSETAEQKDVVRELRRLRALSEGRVRFFAVPNGGSRQQGEGAGLKGAGVVAGVPDLVVLGRASTGPVEALNAVELDLVRRGVAEDAPDSIVRRLLATLDARSGAVLEMKRENGRESHVTDAQRDWLTWFAARLGWVSLVGFGAEDALRKLHAAGYDVRTTVDRSQEDEA